MRVKRFVLIFSSLVLFSLSGCREEVCIIEGTVSNSVFDGELAYLVDSDAPVTKNVDSVIIQGGNFQFESVADSQVYKVIRIPAKFPDVLQDLIVIPEEGHVFADIAPNSKSRGTGLNSKMQQWKEKKEMYDSIQWSIYRQKKELELTEAQIDSLESYSDEAKDLFMDEVMCSIRQNKDNGIGLFLFKLYFHSLPADLKNEILQEKRAIYFENDKQLKNLIAQ